MKNLRNMEKPKVRDIWGLGYHLALGVLRASCTGAQGHATSQDELSPQQPPRVSSARPGEGLPVLQGN